jgi:hypothetical protein
MRICNPEYIEYIKRCEKKTFVITETVIQACSEFAEDCVGHLDALSLANSAGFYDDSGRAWTLHKSHHNGDIRISVKCREKNSIREAKIYPSNHTFVEEEEHDDKVVVSIGHWLVQVYL